MSELWWIIGVTFFGLTFYSISVVLASRAGFERGRLYGLSEADVRYRKFWGRSSPFTLTHISPAVEGSALRQNAGSSDLMQSERVKERRAGGSFEG